ncbi:DUF4198 domain-containing protein [Desulfobacula toluolica]|uniref:Conserved uncharacterized protein n=1 Tax=Desulfobacula toluolica (strain DSM 7467 / Tol2) TaxID=651182 RepID=K0NHA8_DESTT|nr:DUF4198 domain-containing protein [Desulfobacula toluolica]CCK78387.1 conserved uncharacterized protein [Desulfobacula toluolica Tol2]
MFKTCKFKTYNFFLFSLISCFVCLPSVLAHEFIIKPVLMSVEPGEKVPFSVISAHVFMVSQEMEPADKVEVSMIKGDAVTPLKLTSNPILMSQDGIVLCKEHGYSILAGHRKGMIWTQTTQGYKQGGKKGLKNVVSASKKYEKFCKTIIRAGKADNGYGKIINDKLEIVPLTDPGTVKINTEMEFKIIYDGKPFSTDVFATYDGFSANPNTYAYFTQCNSQGIAKVKITHPGNWMVRIQTESKQAGQDYDIHVMRAILVFEVK